MDTIRIAVDAMGGDNSPGALVEGAAAALAKRKEIEILLVGPAEELEAELAKYNIDRERLTVVDAPEVITTDEAPVMAVRRKKNSSLVTAMQLVKKGEAEAYVSAGSTGAVMVGAQLIIGRMKGISRTPIGAIIPNANGVSLLVDTGANVDVRPEHLLQFAQMGSVYMEGIMGIKNPRVALVNVGVEEEKGNALVKEARPLLAACSTINYIGYIEARDIAYGAADVVVADGFAGNVILKMYEGAGGVLLDKMKETLTTNLKTKVGALLIKNELKKTLKAFDINQYGGAPMLGLNKLVVKMHGSSKGKAVYNAICQCEKFYKQRINERIQESMEDGANGL